MTTAAIAPFKTADFNSQLNRSLSKIYLGAASLGEVLATAARIDDGDTRGWFDAWSALATDLERRASDSHAEGAAPMARSLLLRASEAWRQASFFHRTNLDCAQLQMAWPRHSACFQSAMALAPQTCRTLDIPFEGRKLRGYLLSPDKAGSARSPTVVVPSGYDGTAEESAMMIGFPALARGYAVLAFDGPGQGSSLYDPAIRLFMRPDFESVLPIVVDAAIAAPEVDPDRIGAIGVSFGGFLMPRGVSGEPRIKALIADPGQHDIGSAMLARLPDHLKELLAVDGPEAEAAFGKLASGEAAQLFFGPRMAAHGVTGVQHYVRALQAFTLGERAGRIRCPCLVCDNEADTISTTQGRELAGLIGSAVEFVFFTIAEGAGGHCEGVGREIFDERAFAWLDRTLGV